MKRLVNITEIFWGAAPAAEMDPGGAQSAAEVVAHALRSLESFDNNEVQHPESGRPVTLMQLLAEMGIDEDLIYASPELVRGEAFDERSLVFTVGVLIFERLTGRHPFGTSDDKAKVARIRRGEMGSGVNYFPQVPAGLRSILVRAMGPFPEERYSELAQLKSALRQFAAGQPGADLGAAAGDGPTTLTARSLLSEFTPAVDAEPDDAGAAQRGADRSAAWTPGPLKAVSTDEVEHLFDDTAELKAPPADMSAVDRPAADPPATDRLAADRPTSRPLPAAPPATSDRVAQLASRAQQPAARPRPASPMMPVVYVLVGAALASAGFLAFGPRAPQGHPTPGAARVATRAGDPAPPAVAAIEPGRPLATSADERPTSADERPAPAAERPATSAAQASLPAADSPAASAQVPAAVPTPAAAPAAPTREPAAAGAQAPATAAPATAPPASGGDLPPGKASGILVGQAIRACLPSSGGQLRVSVYVRPDGNVVRAFVARTKGVGDGVVRCVRKRAAGLSLPVRLKQAGYVEWRMRFSDADVKVRVARPKGLR